MELVLIAGSTIVYLIIGVALTLTGIKLYNKVVPENEQTDIEESSKRSGVPAEVMGRLMFASVVIFWPAWLVYAIYVLIVPARYVRD